MNSWLLTCVLLAEGGRADQFVKGFREGTLHRTANYDWLLYATAVLALVLLCYAVERFLRNRRPGPVHHEGRLFHDLCRAHGLDRASCGLLRRLARQARLAQVSEVFLKPELFQPDATDSRRDQLLIEQLRGRLFAG